MILDQILNIMKKNSKLLAYTDEKESITYEIMYNYVKNLYSFLEKKVKDKSPIIVYGHKNIFMIVSFLVCSFLGVPYIPIDISMPMERIKDIIKISKAQILLNTISITNIENLNMIKVYEVENICTNNDNCEEIIPKMSGEDIYYIIFTSGTTGEPKGVKVTYNNINSFVKWIQNITINSSSKILNQALFSFDLSVADIYLSLITGSELIVTNSYIQKDYMKLFALLKNSDINVAVMTPSFADLLLLDKSFNKELLPNLKIIYFCGEVLLPTTVKKLYERFPSVKVINSYGPTECTVAVTSINVTKDMLNSKKLPIGISKDDVEIYIVDENLNIIENKSEGEILIAGESVSDGYINDNCKSEKFIKFNNMKAYLTGDIGYKDGNMIYYKSRKDTQIKYKGYRIELCDIEENIYKLQYVERTKIIYKLDENGRVNNLIAFVKLKDKLSIDNKQIKKDLLKFIPYYMCPKIKIIEEFQLNNNGKCDEDYLRGINV